MSKKAREKIARKERTVERRDRMLVHDFSAERATLEEVFDQSTRMVIAGKESRVSSGKTKDGKDLSVKIYLTSSAEFKKGMLKYIEGDYRFKGVKRDTRSLIFTWAQKEFRNLQQAEKAEVRVPKPLAVKSNVLVMEFIGEDGVSAPSLKEVNPEDPEEMYGFLLTFLRRLYRKADLVHGDLSEYNVMVWRGEPVVFGMGQSVPSSHPLARFLLERDLANLNRFFSKLGVKVLSAEEAYRKVAG